MTLKQALYLATNKLSANRDIENPALESEVLLRYALQINRAQLFLETGEELDSVREQLFFSWVERRLNGEPVAYIIQCREFYGLDFFVDRRVLIPRPETELLVAETLNLTKSLPESIIADIGTGSGAIAVSLAVFLPQVKIFATDISSSALEVAVLNCRKHHVTSKITLLHGDLLYPLAEPVDLLIANLPYVKQADLLTMPSSKYEPVLALDGGESGLNQIVRLCHQLKGHVKPGGYALLEIGMGQGPAVKDLLNTLFEESTIDLIPDLAGIDREVKINIC